MTMEERRAEEYDRLNPDLLNLLGHATSSWSSLEFAINDVIWKLADTPPALGACLTTQIYTIDGRLRALLSLLKLYRFSERTISAVNKYVEAIRGPSELRNRLIHDRWGIQRPSGKTAKMVITANKKLRFEEQIVDLADVRRDVDRIIDCLHQFHDLKEVILAELPTLPEIPRTELHPINLVPRPTT